MSRWFLLRGDGMQITGAGGAAHRANGDEGMLARSRSRRASGRTRNQKHTLFPAEEMSASLSPTFWHRSRAPAWSRALAKSRKKRASAAMGGAEVPYCSCLCPFQNKTLVVPVPVVVVVVVNRPPSYCTDRLLFVLAHALTGNLFTGTRYSIDSAPCTLYSARACVSA